MFFKRCTNDIAIASGKRRNPPPTRATGQWRICQQLGKPISRSQSLGFWLVRMAWVELIPGNVFRKSKPVRPLVIFPAMVPHQMRALAINATAIICKQAVVNWYGKHPGFFINSADQAFRHTIRQLIRESLGLLKKAASVPVAVEQNPIRGQRRWLPAPQAESRSIRGRFVAVCSGMGAFCPTPGSTTRRFDRA